MAKFEAPKSLEVALEKIQEEVAAITEDLPKVNKGVAKAGRRVRGSFQTIAKNSKAARALVSALTAKKEG